MKEIRKKRTPAQKARDEEANKKKMKRQTAEQRQRYRKSEYKQRHQKCRDARVQKEAGAADETQEAYWSDKPFFRTKEEVIELCNTDKLDDDRRKEILDAVRKRLGRKAPLCVCTTCGEACLYREGEFKNLTDEWFDNFKVTQEDYNG